MNWEIEGFTRICNKSGSTTTMTTTESHKKDTVIWWHYPSKTRCWNNAGLMLVQRCWRWASIKPRLTQRVCLVYMWHHRRWTKTCSKLASLAREIIDHPQLASISQLDSSVTFVSVTNWAFAFFFVSSCQKGRICTRLQENKLPIIARQFCHPETKNREVINSMIMPLIYLVVPWSCNSFI